MNYRLPGVFVDNRYPNAVNGSIWVIPLFFGSYLFLLCLKLIDILKDNLRGTASIGCLMMIAVIAYFNKISFGWHDYSSFYVLLSILFGCLLCCLRNVLDINLRFFIGVLILYFLFKKTVLSYVFKLLVVFIGSLWLSHKKFFLLVKPKINLSLGLFLYAFPVQQIFACMYPKSSPLFNFLSSTIVTVLIAFLSYWCVERFCYKGANKIYKFIEEHKLIL